MNRRARVAIAASLLSAAIATPGFGDGRMSGGPPRFSGHDFRGGFHDRGFRDRDFRFHRHFGRQFFFITPLPLYGYVAPYYAYYWYCPNPPGYYPYVIQCLAPWLPVPPPG